MMKRSQVTDQTVLEFYQLNETTSLADWVQAALRQRQSLQVFILRCVDRTVEHKVCTCLLEKMGAQAKAFVHHLANINSEFVRP